MITPYEKNVSGKETVTKYKYTNRLEKSAVYCKSSSYEKQEAAEKQISSQAGFQCPIIFYLIEAEGK